jgi:hypothetical protein
MLHPLQLNVPELDLRVPVQRGGEWKQEVVPTPAILTSSWESSQGRIGHLFVNISESTQPLRVNLDTRTASSESLFDAEIYRSTQGSSFKPLWQKAVLPTELVTDMTPLEVVFVELRGHKGE